MKITFHDIGRTVDVEDGIDESGIDDIHDSLQREMGNKQLESKPNFLNILAKAARSSMGPQLQAAGGAINTAGFGLPGLAMDKMLPQQAKDYLKPQSLGEGIGRGIGDVGGFMLGGPEQIAAKGAERLLPKMANPFLRGAVKGGSAMASLSPVNMLQGSSPQGEAMKAGLGGVLGGTAEAVGPYIGQAYKGTKNFIQNIPNKARTVFNAPKESARLGSEIADIEGQIARTESEASAPNMAREGEAIIKRADKSIQTDLDTKLGELDKQSRSVFAKHSDVAKKRMSDVTKSTYDTYGKILQKGEEEATASGMTADDYREEVINPVLETIDKTGARTPTAEKLKKLFQPKEGLSDASYQKADEASLKNFENLSSVEKMKALRSSLYKEGSDDFIQTQYSDLHQRFIGKYSPSVAEANKSYGPMKQALRWGNKNIKPFHSDEVKRVADLVEKANRGTLDETQAAYLKTLKTGKGDFKGVDITKLGKSHQKAVDAIEAEIKSTKDMMSKLETQTLEDVATVRSGGMQSEIGKQNLLQKSAGDKSRLAQLKQLKSQVDRDVKTRDDLIRFGIIYGLATFGVGKGVYALSKALHEPNRT